MCQAIVLAAGYSSRAKTNKLALTIKGIPVLTTIVMTLEQICDDVIVVSGHYHEEVSLMMTNFSKVQVVHNQNYDLGMFSSVKAGLEWIDTDFFVIPGDCPLVEKNTCEQLLECEGSIVVPTYHGKRGHPMLIRKALINALKEEPITSNLKAFRDRCLVQYLPVADPYVLLDLDTQEAYNALIETIEDRGNVQ